MRVRLERGGIFWLKGRSIEGLINILLLRLVIVDGLILSLRNLLFSFKARIIPQKLIGRVGALKWVSTLTILVRMRLNGVVAMVAVGVVCIRRNERLGLRRVATTEIYLCV